MLKAHIAVISKNRKDPSQPANYRSISLLNVNIKLFSKIQANRLLPFLLSIVHRDQVGFIPVHEARDSTIKALNLHHALTQKGFFLSLDAGKACDGVAQDYMEATLNELDLGTQMPGFIMSFHVNTLAEVCVNNTLSDAISSEMEQGMAAPYPPFFLYSP